MVGDILRWKTLLSKGHLKNRCQFIITFYAEFYDVERISVCFKDADILLTNEVAVCYVSQKIIPVDGLETYRSIKSGILHPKYMLSLHRNSFNIFCWWSWQ